MDAEDLLCSGILQLAITDDTVANSYTNRVLQKVIGITEINDEILFLIKWENIEQPELIRRDIAKVMWPQEIIKFYEERLLFSNSI